MRMEKTEIQKFGTNGWVRVGNRMRRGGEEGGGGGGRRE